MIGNRFRGFALMFLIGTAGPGVECTFAQAQKAPAAPSAREAVDRHIAAIGGRAAVDSLHTTHMWVTLTAFGLTGRTELWLAPPDRRATQVALGPFTLKDGCDSTRAWRTDPTGQVITLDGHDLEEAKADAWFENDRWLAPGFGGGTVTVVGPEEDARGKYFVLDVVPPAGRTRRVYLDRDTWLVDRYVSKRDQATVTVRLSDYRVVQGRKLAFRSVQQIEGMPANDATVYVDSIRVDEPIPPERWAPPAEKPSALRYLKNPGVARLPFDYSVRHVWLSGGERRAARRFPLRHGRQPHGDRQRLRGRHGARHRRAPAGGGRRGERDRNVRPGPHPARRIAR